MNTEPKKTFLMTKNPYKYEIPGDDSSFVKKMEIAKRGMKKYKKALAELAR